MVWLPWFDEGTSRRGFRLRTEGGAANILVGAQGQSRWLERRWTVLGTERRRRRRRSPPRSATGHRSHPKQRCRAAADRTRATEGITLKPRSEHEDLLWTICQRLRPPRGAPRSTQPARAEHRVGDGRVRAQHLIPHPASAFGTSLSRGGTASPRRFALRRARVITSADRLRLRLVTAANTWRLRRLTLPAYQDNEQDGRSQMAAARRGAEGSDVGR